MPLTADSPLTEQQLHEFRTHGYVVVRGLLNTHEVATIRDAFMEQGKNGPVPGLSETIRGTAPSGYDRSDPLAFYPRMMHPHRHPELPLVGALAMRYMLDERIGAILRELFADEPIATQSMFYFKPPGARGQDLHQDNFYLRVKPGTCLAAWTAIDDADESNGGLVVVPGSSNLDIACPEASDTSQFFTAHHVEPPPGLKPAPVNLKAGDVLFFNGSVIHGSYPNTSKDRFRRAFICHYVPASSVECSHFYRPLQKFDGTEVMIADATGGGPCGEMVEAPKAPH